MAPASQFHVYLLWGNAHLAKRLKCESASRRFHQEKALGGAYSVIVKTDGLFAALVCPFYLFEPLVWLPIGNVAAIRPPVPQSAVALELSLQMSEHSISAIWVSVCVLFSVVHSCWLSTYRPKQKSDTCYITW